MLYRCDTARNLLLSEGVYRTVRHWIAIFLPLLVSFPVSRTIVFIIKEIIRIFPDFKNGILPVFECKVSGIRSFIIAYFCIVSRRVQRIWVVVQWHLNSFRFFVGDPVVIRIILRCSKDKLFICRCIGRYFLNADFIHGNHKVFLNNVLTCFQVFHRLTEAFLIPTGRFKLL